MVAIEVTTRATINGCHDSRLKPHIKEFPGHRVAINSTDIMSVVDNGNRGCSIMVATACEKFEVVDTYEEIIHKWLKN